VSDRVPPGLTVAAIAGHAYLVSDDRGRRVAFAAGAGGTTWVFLDGLVHEVRTGRAGAESSAPDDVLSALAAPMPARVSHIGVEPGQQVDAGQTLLVLEAMKMELPITAPRRGVIRSIACQVGDLVAPGVALVEME